MKPDLRELVLEHLEEHGKKMVDSPKVLLEANPTHSLRKTIDILLLAQDGSEATDLSAKRGAHVLGGV